MTASDGSYSVRGLLPSSTYLLCFDGRSATGGLSHVAFAGATERPLVRGRVVGVDQHEVRLGGVPDLGEPSVVGLDLRPVAGDETLHPGQGPRCAVAAVELAVVIERVADVQDPLLARIHRDGRVPAAVPGQAIELATLGWLVRTDLG